MNCNSWSSCFGNVTFIWPVPNRPVKAISLFLFLASICCYGQEKVLQGKITNTEDIEGIHILNTASRYNSVTDAYGNFAITVQPLDTLVFSSVHYRPERVLVTQAIFEKGILVLTLTEQLNELDEVFLGPNLSGRLGTDIRNIPILDTLNFDDVGIPGFKGKPQEKIVPIVPYFGLASAMDLEALYKHLSGYYRKLRIKRSWDAENESTVAIIAHYGDSFFQKAYGIPQNRLYDFILFCMETTSLQNDFRKEHFAGVLEAFETQSKIYLKRLVIKEE